MNSEAAMDKARKAQEQADGAASELSQAQSNISKLEKAKGQLEKQVSLVGHFVCNVLLILCVCLCRSRTYVSVLRRQSLWVCAR